MADKKISQLPAATLPLAGTELLPIVQNGTTDNITVNNLAAGNIKSNATTGVLQVTGPAAGATRVMTTPDANFTVARIDAANSFTADQTLSTGNLVIGTSGKGIDFSATGSGSGTMTSELLSDYEEGTWTPVDASGAGITLTVYSAKYTKVGNLVTVTGAIAYAANVDGTAAKIGGLPFASSVYTTVPMTYYNNGSVPMIGYIAPNTSDILVVSDVNLTIAITNNIMSSCFSLFSATYQV